MNPERPSVLDVSLESRSHSPKMYPWLADPKPTRTREEEAKISGFGERHLIIFIRLYTTSAGCLSLRAAAKAALPAGPLYIARDPALVSMLRRRKISDPGVLICQ